jgi:2,4-dienoyl-CoA reductase-like NADH-dependent reductase (Old Yellow Enzyme family)
VPVLTDRRVTNAFWITRYGFDGDSAEAIVASGDADLVAFGRHFSSNRDLPYRLKHKLPLTPYVRAAFWGGDEKALLGFPRLFAYCRSRRSRMNRTALRRFACT